MVVCCALFGGFFYPLSFMVSEAWVVFCGCIFHPYFSLSFPRGPFLVLHPHYPLIATLAIFSSPRKDEQSETWSFLWWPENMDSFFACRNIERKTDGALCGFCILGREINGKIQKPQRTGPKKKGKQNQTNKILSLGNIGAQHKIWFVFSLVFGLLRKGPRENNIWQIWAQGR